MPGDVHKFKFKNQKSKCKMTFTYSALPGGDLSLKQKLKTKSERDFSCEGYQGDKNYSFILALKNDFSKRICCLKNKKFMLIFELKKDKNMGHHN
jgi:hypothetical protein